MEIKMTINRIDLTPDQVFVMRVAVGNLAKHLAKPAALGTGEAERQAAESYQICAADLAATMRAIAAQEAPKGRVQ